jgi:hypothetical protein
MFDASRRIALALLGTCVAGCDDPPSAGEAFVMMVGETCQKTHECRAEHPGPGALFVAEYGDSVDQCRMRYGLAGVIGGMIEDQVDQGIVDYDADAAVSCLEGLEDAECDQLWLPLGGLRRPSACGAVFTRRDE